MIRRIIGWLAVVVCLSAIAGTFWIRADSKAELDAIQERLRASGAPMSVTEMLPPAVATELNAASLYLELDALYEVYDFQNEIDEQLIDLSEDDLWLEDIYCLRISDADWSVVGKILQDDRLPAQLELINRISACPYFQPNWKYEDGPGMIVAELGVMRMASVHLLLLAAQAVRVNDVEAANAYLAQVISLSEHAEQGSILISYLTGIAIRGKASKFMEAASLQFGDTVGFDSSRWLHTAHDRWQASIDCERLAMGDLMFQAIISGDSDAMEKVMGDPVPRGFGVTKFSPFASFFRYDYIHYLTYMEAERAAEGGFFVDYLERSTAIQDQTYSGNGNKYKHMISRIILPALGKVREVVFRSDAQNVVNFTALQLANYHRNTGVYPDSLAALVPDYFDSLPMDLFNGTPLVYRKQLNGFELYSVGPNLKDDGGKTDDNGSATQRAGDIIWAGAGSTLTRTVEP
ncbi:MAG: hypothetical protein ACSHX8_07935 [Opitutaceae bacterium]